MVLPRRAEASLAESGRHIKSGHCREQPAHSVAGEGHLASTL
jgi:hypothetical protein